MPTVTEDWTQRRLRISDGRWVADRVFVVTGASSDLDALSAPGVPQTNNSHPGNARLLVRDRGADPYEKVVGAYKITVSYAVPDDSKFNEDTDGEDDPLSLPHTVVWQRSLISEPVDYVRNWAVTDPTDQNAYIPIMNSAEDGLSQPPSRDFTERRFSVIRAEPYYDDEIASAWENTVNNADITIPRAGTFKAGSLRLFTISPNDPIKADQTHIYVTYEFGVRNDGWSLRILDQGKRARFGPDGKHVGPIVSLPRKKADPYEPEPSRQGDPVFDDVLLNGYGGLLNSEDYAIGEQSKIASSNKPSPPLGSNREEVIISGNTTAVFLRWYPYEYKDFSLLGLG